jgi:hypothetical protein
MLSPMADKYSDLFQVLDTAVNESSGVATYKFHDQVLQVTFKPHDLKSDNMQE